ncbi:phenol-soluble modulin export ABC transporter ATP-binding protein PmtA [Salinicoccus jeotgali]|uniref:Phenol-soluble modulin export ABC transporter ATP-binding protein PmtA n=1 Tax=Salinicoccus jeotgali TaxID=381634 RepID=A0ABP7EQ39_9STAP
MNALTITGLNKDMGRFRLKDITLNIRKGYITGMIGENGAGKSTLIQHILSLKKQDEGQISILGQDLETEREALLNRIGVVMSENYLPQNISPKKLNKLLAVYYKNWRPDKFFSFLKRFNIDEASKIKYFSTGEKAKLSIAVALSHEAELLILDEPTSNLDPTFRRELLDILQTLMMEENTTILFSTHITTDLEKIADYIVMIDEGEIVFDMEREVLFDSYKKVKGDLQIIEDADELLIGTTTNALGFEAMTREHQALEELYGNKVLIENLTIEEIMYFLKNTKRGVDNE